MERFWVFITSLNPKVAENMLLLLIYDSSSQPRATLVPRGHLTASGDNWLPHTESWWVCDPIIHGRQGSQGSCWASNHTRDFPPTNEHPSQKVNSAVVETMMESFREPSPLGKHTSEMLMIKSPRLTLSIHARVLPLWRAARPKARHQCAVIC